MFKKNKDLFKFIGIIAIILLLLVGLYTIYGGILANILYNAVFYGKYNTMLISEIIIVLFAIIIISVRKLWPQIRSKKENFITGIKRGMPILVIAIIMLIVNGGELLIDGEFNIPNFISLVLVSIAIGIAEEFIFRGWLQNEVMDRFGEGKKGALITILMSGLLFGLFHIINVFSGQDLFTSLMQVIQTSAIGILFCSVYFASRNIWSLVFLHSFYDFSVLLGEVNSYKDCINNTDVSMIVNIITLIISLIFAIIYITYSYLNIKNDANTKRRVTQIIVLAVLAMFITSYLSPREIMDKQICFSYEEIDIDNGKITYFLEDEFVINYVNDNNYIYNYRIFIENNKLNITNLKTGDNTTLDENVYNFVVYEDCLNYVILVNSSDKVFLSTFMNKNNLSDDSLYLDEIVNSFVEFDTPEVIDVGYIEYNGTIYPLLKSYISDYFIIKDNQVMVIKGS